MIDSVIAKPIHASSYQLHRLVAEITGGKPSLYLDQGATLLVRSDKAFSLDSKPVRAVANGEVTVFHLRASPFFRKGGKNGYFRAGDWRARREWLEKQAVKHGFELMAVHVTAAPMEVICSKNRHFTIDCTDFTGALKVVDAQKFSHALATGIGRVGKAFGMGLILI